MPLLSQTYQSKQNRAGIRQTEHVEAQTLNLNRATMAAEAKTEHKREATIERSRRMTMAAELETEKNSNESRATKQNSSKAKK